MGELHLDIIVDRMKREFKVEANVGAPQVAYKETIKTTAEAEGKYIKQSGGRGQYGHCWLRVEPQERGVGYEFLDEVKGGVIPREYLPAIQKVLKKASLAASKPATRWWILRWPATMVLTTKWILRKSLLKWPALWLFNPLAAKPTR